MTRQPPTPGATRAAKIIANGHKYTETAQGLATVEMLARIIDHETDTLKLVAACKSMRHAWDLNAPESVKLRCEAMKDIREALTVATSNTRQKETNA